MVYSARWPDPLRQEFFSIFILSSKFKLGACMHFSILFFENTLTRLYDAGGAAAAAVTPAPAADPRAAAAAAAERRAAMAAAAEKRLTEVAK